VPFMTPVAMEQSMKSGKEELDEKDDDSGFRRPKTGNPRKLPKKLRKATKSINKIRF